MKKKFAFNLLFFASILFTASVFETAAQKKPEPKKDPILELWKKQRDKSFEKRTEPVGVEAEGIVVPSVLSTSTVNQRAKLDEMQQGGYTTPLDYADLAERFMKGELVELSLATETYYLDVGSIVTNAPLTSFNFDKGKVVLKTTDAKYQTLKKLADDFGGTKYDLNKPADRKQFKLRLLRTIAPQAKPALEDLAAAYQKRFNRPLRITSISRSIEYQIDLSQVDANSFKVRGKDSLPAHVTGLAFDIAYIHMTAEEQNFLMNKIEDLELKGKADGIREYGANPTLHVFVYADGKPAKVVE